jgi:cyclic 2,3-diphosphoglycerate synthetase
MKVLALVDGEHYPPVTRWGLEHARSLGYEIALAWMVGGSEKLSDRPELTDLGPVPVVSSSPESDLARDLERTLGAHGPFQGVLDLSDEPVLSYRTRMELIGVTLAAGLPYIGADFRFDPPITEAPLPTPTVGVIGTGKRVAKTAVSAHLARLAAASGRHPVIVAMGRGGPADPVVVRPGEATLRHLMVLAERGEHAASDYLEDAVTAGVPTVGARRCGGGLAGRPFVTNLARAAVRAAIELRGDPVILEGSGASVPTVPWDAGVLVIPAGLAPEHLGGYLGPYRVLLSDLLVSIIDTGPTTGLENLSTLEVLVRRLHPGIRVARAELQPVPLADVRGKDAFFATTAPDELAVRLGDHVQRTAGCRVVKVSSRLANRAGLEEDLAAAPAFDVLLTEIKAAGVDVAARWAVQRGADVVFVDNRPVAAGGDGDVDDLLREVAGLAEERTARRLET